FYRDESFDARRLRRPRGHILLLDPVSSGDAREFGGGDWGRHDAGRASLGVVLVATGRALRPLRSALAPDARADPHGRRRPVAFPDPLREPGVGLERGCSDVHTAIRLRDQRPAWAPGVRSRRDADRKSTRLNSSHVAISYAVF